jgi:hypothetical protein
MLLMKRKYMTVIDKVYTALVERGEELTAKQIAARFGTKKPRQVIYQLRNEGLDIELTSPLTPRAVLNTSTALVNTAIDEGQRHKKIAREIICP